MKTYSTKVISEDLIEEIAEALKSIRWGSVEIFVQDNDVVQIVERHIKKTNKEEKSNGNYQKKYTKN